jgi:hypothetical protein
MFTRQQVINLYDSSLTSVTRQLTTTKRVSELVGALDSSYCRLMWHSGA